MANMRDNVSGRAAERSGTRLRVTVLGYPSADNAIGRVSFHADVAMAKSAALYADEVELVNPAIQWASLVTEKANRPPHEFVRDYLVEKFGIDMNAPLSTFTLVQQNAFLMTFVVANPDQAEVYQSLVEVGLLPEDATIQFLDSFYEERNDLLSKAAKARRRMQHDAMEALADTGYIDIVDMANEGFLKSIKSHLSMEQAQSNHYGEYFDMLKRRLEDPQSRLLFDSRVSVITRSLVAQGHIKPPATTLKSARTVAVGAGLIARLPAFPMASTEGIIQLREELKGPLTRYRKEVYELADSLTYQPFDPESVAEIEDLWISKVEPEVLNVKEHLAQHSYIRELAKEMSTGVKALIEGGTGGGFWIAASSFTSINELVATAAGAGTAVAPSAIRAAQKRAEERQGVNGMSNGFFYLYEADRRL